MPEPLASTAFDEWVRFLFDRQDANWQYDWRTADPPLSGRELVSCLRRLFEGAGELLAPYSPDQVGWGLQYLVGVSDAMHGLLDPAIPWPERSACLRATHRLYEQVFEPRCSPSLGHLERGGSPAPLNTVCYMWWDLFPSWGSPGDTARRQLDHEVLSVLEGLLALRSPACLESALHGLGHWHLSHPTEVEAVIDAYLSGAPALSPELRGYAEAARSGCVN